MTSSVRFHRAAALTEWKIILDSCTPLRYSPAVNRGHHAPGKGCCLSKLTTNLFTLAAVAVLLSSCGGYTSPGPQSTAVLTVNGTSVSSSVEIGSVRIYTLSNIIAGNQYLLRTVIAPGGALTASVYTSMSSYKAGEPPVVTAVGVVPNNFYEASFTATTSGDYVVVLSGTPVSTAYTALYFYNLRLMSATGSALSPLATNTVDPSTGATTTGSISPDTIVVYSGASITPSPKSYSITLTAATDTISYPQMFIYNDSSLSLLSPLLYSVVTNTPFTAFTISDFSLNSISTPSTFPTATPILLTTATISAVSFPTGSGGPFIMLRGVSQATYTVQIGPSSF